MAEKESVFAGLEPTEKGARSVDRIKERFAMDSVPAGLPVFAGSESGINDLYMNLNRQLGDGKIEEKTKLIVAIGVAAALGSAPAVELFTNAAVQKGRTKQESLDAVSVGTVCTIFNGYYRFRHQIPDSLRGTFEAFRAPFNANTFMKTTLTPFETEAICITVSSINNCHVCVEGHLHKGQSLGMTEEQIDELIKTGAVAAATSRVLAALAPSNPTLAKA